MTTALVGLGLGAVIGLVLGALGGGGSILAIPALVYVIGQSPQAATTTSLVVVGAGVAGGLVTHLRRGTVDVRAGLGFGALGIVGSLLGTRVNQVVGGDLLLASFAALMLAVAGLMWARATPRGHANDRRVEPVEGPGRWLRLALAGSGVGFLTGLFGVGGGFVIVPALVLTLRFAMHVAIGTSLVVIMVNVSTALAGRAGTMSLDWAVTLAFTAGVLAGSSGGASLAARLEDSRLRRGFAGLLIVIAGVMLWESVPALAAAV